MNKRIKISINKIPRENRIVDVKEIPKILRRKWINTAIENSDDFVIQIFPPSYVEEYTLSGWSVSHKDNNQIIRLKDCTGKIQEYDINKLVAEKETKNQKKKIDLFENVIEQARLIFLTGNYKDFECAFNHIENRIKYEKNKVGDFEK